MKEKRLFILIGAIVLVVAAFWLLDFCLAFSSTTTEKLVMTTDTGGNFMPVSMQRKERLSLLMVGEGALVKELEQAGPGLDAPLCDGWILRPCGV